MTNPDVASELQIEYVPIGELQPASYNPRRLNAENKRRLKRGLQIFGIVDPIIVRREDKTVIGGHQRLLLATELGYTTMPVIYVDGYDDDKAAKLNVFLNNPDAQGEFDFAKVRELLRPMSMENLDALTGFDNEKLESLRAMDSRVQMFAEEIAERSPGARPTSDRDTHDKPRHVPVYPLSVLVSMADKRRWDAYKTELGIADDSRAFLALLATVSPVPKPL